MRACVCVQTHNHMQSQVPEARGDCVRMHVCVCVCVCVRKHTTICSHRSQRPGKTACVCVYKHTITCSHRSQRPGKTVCVWACVCANTESYAVTGPRDQGRLHAYAYACVCVLSLVQLFSDSMNCSPPGSSVHGIFQARILEWADTSSSRGSSQPRD